VDFLISTDNGLKIGDMASTSKTRGRKRLLEGAEDNTETSKMRKLEKQGNK